MAKLRSKLSASIILWRPRRVTDKYARVGEQIALVRGWERWCEVAPGYLSYRYRTTTRSRIAKRKARSVRAISSKERGKYHLPRTPSADTTDSKVLPID